MTSCKEPSPELPAILNDLEGLQFQMACALNALDAIHAAMSCGEYNPTGYLDGLYGIHNHMDKLNLEIKNKLAEMRVILKAKTAT